MTGADVDRVETARMVCERLRPDHYEELCRLLLDPDVERTQWPFPYSQTPDHVSRALAAKLEHWDRHGFGMWLMRDRATGEMIGRGGLQYTNTAGLRAVEVGWAVVPARWGQGLATELAHASAEVAFLRLCLPYLVAMTLPDNLASRRVMEKAGFVYEREIVHAGLPHLLYRLAAEEWSAAGVR